MKRIITPAAVLAVLLISSNSAEDRHNPEIATVCLADVSVTARPTGKRHQSYIFTLKSKKADSSWTFELSHDFGGSLLLHVAGNRMQLDEQKELQSWHHKSTTLKLQNTDPEKTRTGETITHKLVSFTWGQQEPNNSVEDIGANRAESSR